MKVRGNSLGVWLVAFALSLYPPGCVQQSAGHEQPITLTLVGELNPRVAEASLTIASIELQPCEDKSQSRASWWRALSSGAAPTARAHSMSTALRVGSPQVVAVHGRTGKQYSLGAFRAPQGTYCSVQLELAPADADASGLAAADGGTGMTLRVRFHDETPAMQSSSQRVHRVLLSPALGISGEPRVEPLDLQLDRAHWDEDSLQSADRSLSRLASAFGTSG